jgi:hypothetical protein
MMRKGTLRGTQRQGDRILDAAFAAMVSEFESSTGRPLRPGDLPQR